jgi:hypothetical protein
VHGSDRSPGVAGAEETLNWLEVKIPKSVRGADNRLSKVQGSPMVSDCRPKRSLMTAKYLARVGLWPVMITIIS